MFKGVNNEIHQGEVVCVIGPSGSGKSTFLRCLNLLEIPTKGEITIDGIPAMENLKSIDSLRTRVGMVFQQFNLFPNMTVLKISHLRPHQSAQKSPEEPEATARSLLSSRVLYMDQGIVYEEGPPSSFFPIRAIHAPKSF